MGRGSPASNTFVSIISMRPVKSVLAILLISIVSLIYASSAKFYSHDRFNHPSSILRSIFHRSRTASSSFLEVFQVYPPVLTVSPEGVLEITDGSTNASVKVIDNQLPTCQETLAVYSFANSYGKPYVGEYNPPTCSFNRVTWNLTVLSTGKQFDRLGIVYLGDIEVFRTSTAEPTADGIQWTYLKDVTNFLSLFETNQKLIFDLGNLINDIYTAPFHVTLTASYFTAADSVTPADLILPVSGRRSAQDMPSVFTVPPQTASNVLRLPRNVKKAVFTVAATGQSEEEFWWSNVLQSDVNTFPQYGLLYGYSPFREVQLLIDGMLAGVAWPFPIIFTGGVVPGLWRPIVGIDAFDLKEDEIDITPWLPLLCDGRSHNFTIHVSGLVDNGKGAAVLSETTDSYWLVTGKVFIWLDVMGHVTTGDGPHKHTPSPELQVSSSIETIANGTNGTLLYQVNARRSLSFESTINLSHGTEVSSWRQYLTFQNAGNFSDGANVEINNQQTYGYDVSSSGYARQYSYPLYAYSVVGSQDGNLTIMASVTRGKDVKIIGVPVFPTGLESLSAADAVQARYPTFQGAWLSTNQSGTATYLANDTAKTSFSFGTTAQDMSFHGIRVDAQHGSKWFPEVTGSTELFLRHVEAVNSTVIDDQETLVGFPIGHTHSSESSDRKVCAPPNVRGRGTRWYEGRSWRG